MSEPAMPAFDEIAFAEECFAVTRRFLLPSARLAIARFKALEHEMRFRRTGDNQDFRLAEHWRETAEALGRLTKPTGILGNRADFVILDELDGGPPPADADNQPVAAGLPEGDH
jgi:hypothetical protein